MHGFHSITADVDIDIEPPPKQQSKPPLPIIAKNETTNLNLATLEDETASILQHYGSKRKSKPASSLFGISSLPSPSSSRRLPSRGRSRGHPRASLKGNSLSKSRLLKNSNSKRCHYDTNTNSNNNNSMSLTMDQDDQNQNQNQNPLSGNPSHEEATATAAATVIQHFVRYHNQIHRNLQHHRAPSTLPPSNDNRSHNCNHNHGSLRQIARHASQTRLFRDDGTATSHLRTSISNAFKTNRLLLALL